MELVIVHPQIPPNTGNIARTCAATETPLHLIGPMGFELSNKYLKRAGLDYWPHVQLTYHSSVNEFIQFSKNVQTRWIGFSKNGRMNYTQFSYKPNDMLLFGSELYGIPKEMLSQCFETVYIPMTNPNIRCLNLAVCAGIGLFEAIRQIHDVLST